MKKSGYYTSGELMKIAHITKKTVRYYDEHNILKPSYVSPTGIRYYTDSDLAKLQQILLFKSLGFSLEDIRQITINDSDYHFMQNSLKLQLKLVEDRIEQLQVIAQTIQNTTDTLEKEKKVDWSHMLDILNISGMEKSLKNQYQNASNISTRINLHSLYAQNMKGWFPFIYEQSNLTNHMNILELGCGDGAFWMENYEKIPKDVSIVLSDISEGMLRDTRRSIGYEDRRFSYQVFNCESIPYDDQTFDIVIANHVLFYCDLEKVCSEVRRVLKPNGVFICSTYGDGHMKEMRQLVSSYDSRIVLSANNLYERFGKENGRDILSPYFSSITWNEYEDHLLVPDAEPLISYVLSCHGNQNQYLLDRYHDFRSYVKKSIGKGFYITKEAGIFICKK